MLTLYLATGGALDRRPHQPGETLPDNAVWLDMLHPTPEEDKAVEACVGVAVPTEEDMQEIEASSRLYFEDGARYMTASVLAGVKSDKPGLVNVGFILAGNRLITVRRGEPRSVELYIQRVCKQQDAPQTGEAILLGLLEAIIDRTADILERAGSDIDMVSHRIFARPEKGIRQKKDYMAILRTIGRKGDLLSMARESLVSLSRMVGFLSVDAGGQKVSKQASAQLSVMRRDAESLRDHTSYLGDKITFLLDATVGMVTIEQNDLVKLFSVVAVILMPPTLIASTYGMNFEYMPELSHPWGYPIALIAMLLSAVVPYLIFRLKRWL
ncbi:magnesium transporter CorA family protein [Flaviflagellibacter deserti]|uniref:Magnesium transporter CorA family protein n=1 Tax=Flaviflagellibacter deserti TaxID=2267266 RepID=A0ABV9YWG5_9HYPH